jgi:hypothetical protein
MSEETCHPECRDGSRNGEAQSVSVANPCHVIQVDPSRQDQTTDAAHLSPQQSPVAALQQLPGEAPRAFSMFIRFASMRPQPPFTAFADEVGVHRNTINNWKSLYRWEDRLNAFHRLCCQRLAEPEPVTPAAPAAESDRDERRLDLRANAMKLARLAIEAWEPDAQPMTVQGVVRALELACKLNPPPASADDLKNSASERRYAEFMARLDRIYGPQSQTATTP